MFGRSLFSARVVRAALALLFLTIATAVALGTGRNSASAPPKTAAPPACTDLEKFRAKSFPERPQIHNRFLPMIPGIRTVLEGSVDGVPHRVQATVTDLTKKVNGVSVLVAWETDTADGKLVESELAFFAEDKAGNVWNLGEYAEEYEYDARGRAVNVSTANTWIAGRKGAKAGIRMADRPIVSPNLYAQRFAPKVDVFECAKAVAKRRNRKVCVALGCYGSALVTHETNLAIAGDGMRSSYHAPGKGVVKTGAVDPSSGEALELVARERIRGAEWQAALKAALELDKRGYELGADGGYSATSPATRLPFRR
jgi:hypothetical protein